VQRWVPVIDEITRACLDERIEDGHIDFVDDLANIVPAVLTLGLMGVPLNKWDIYCEPAHATVYTPVDSPDRKRVDDLQMASAMDLMEHVANIRETPRPGLIDAMVRLRVEGQPPPDIELIGMLMLLIGRGFDTTTALTAHALEWLSQHPDERDRLSRERDALLDPATEEFLRYFTPAPGDGRTVAEDLQVGDINLKEGERLWLSWAMANRDAEIFDDPNEVILDRKGNRHFSFGLGIHRCIGQSRVQVNGDCSTRPAARLQL
jgi:cytochrome P450